MLRHWRLGRRIQWWFFYYPVLMPTNRVDTEVDQIRVAPLKTVVHLLAWSKISCSVVRRNIPPLISLKLMSDFKFLNNTTFLGTLMAHYTVISFNFNRVSLGFLRAQSTWREHSHPRISWRCKSISDLIIRLSIPWRSATTCLLKKVEFTNNQ